MATQTVSFDLEYAANCPTCAAEGIGSQLGLISGEGICCNGPTRHDFDTLPEAQDLTQATASEPRRRHPITNVLANDPEAPPLPVGDVGAQPAEPNRVPQVATSAEIQTAAAPEPLPAGSVHLELWEPQPIPGGNVVVLIEISEGYAAILAAEAEAQQHSIGEHLRELVARMQANQWT